MFYFINWHYFAKYLFKLILIFSIFSSTIYSLEIVKQQKIIFPRDKDYDFDVVFQEDYRNNYSLDFFLVGDIGGKEVEKDGKIINHKPSNGQILVAEEMKKLKNKKIFERNISFDPKFVLNLGDNFYDSGIGPEEADERFEKTFYTAYSSLSLPFNSIPGNNDYKLPKDEKVGDKEKKEEKEKEKKEEKKKDKDEEKKLNDETFKKARKRVHAQIEHTNHRNLWFFPSEYYVLKYNMANFKIVFIVIDTYLLCGGSRKDSIALKEEDKLIQSQKSKRKLAQEKHFKWLENVFSRKYIKEADYLFVAGHYPIYMSEGDRAFTCASRLQQLFFKNKVSAYLSGHEHSLKYIKVINKFNSNQFFHQIISGAGTKIENGYQQKHVFSQMEDETTINLSREFLFCFPNGINQTQREENKKLKNYEETKKTELESELDKLKENNSDKNIIKQKEKELKVLEEKLDAASYEDGGFVAVHISKDFAEFKFFSVSEKFNFIVKVEKRQN